MRIRIPKREIVTPRFEDQAAKYNDQDKRDLLPDINAPTSTSASLGEHHGNNLADYVKEIELTRLLAQVAAGDTTKEIKRRIKELKAERTKLKKYLKSNLPKNKITISQDTQIDPNTDQYEDTVIDLPPDDEQEEAVYSEDDGEEVNHSPCIVDVEPKSNLQDNGFNIDTSVTLIPEDQNLEHEYSGFNEESPTKPLGDLPSTTIRRLRESLIASGCGCGLVGVSALIITAVVAVLANKDPELSKLLMSDLDKLQISIPDEEKSSNLDQAIQEAKTIWDKVNLASNARPESAKLSVKGKIRLEASATNELVASLHSDAKTWSDSKEAFEDLKGKVTKWGGYPTLVKSAEAGNVDSISEWIDQIDSDKNIPNNHLVAENFKDQIRLIKDKTINPDQEKVETELAKITPEQVNKVVDEKLAHPPAIPKPFHYPTSSTASYDAPEEPVTVLADRQTLNEIPDLSEFLEEEDEDLGEYLVDMGAPTMDDAFDAIDPGNFKIAQQEIPVPVIGNPLDPIEPAFVKPVQVEIKTESKVETPKKGIVESAVTKVSGWLGSAKKWFA